MYTELTALFAFHNFFLVLSFGVKLYELKIFIKVMKVTITILLSVRSKQLCLNIGFHSLPHIIFQFYFIFSLKISVMGKAEGSGEQWHGHVTALSVAPEFRRLGLAGKLMNGLEEISER